MKSTIRGRSHGKIDKSTWHEPSTFERVPSIHDSYSPVGTNPVDVDPLQSIRPTRHRKANEKVIVYILSIKYYILIIMICHTVVDHALSFLSQVVHTSLVRYLSYDTYIIHFLNDIHPFIQYIIDVPMDENCRFRAIAALLGMGEDSWSQVWADLLQELDSYKHYYEPIFRGFIIV